MSQFKGMTRYGRRARLAAMIVSAALALPGVSIANHTTCDKQSNEVGPGTNCPEFSPGIDAAVSNPVIDSESTLSFEYSQADHESSTMLVEAYAPKHWQFNTQIRPSAVADACTGSAEAISGNSWRLRSLAGTNRAATERTGAAYFGAYDAGTQTITGCARLSGSVNLPFTISRLAGTHPYAATHDWKITLSTRAFVESIKANTGSMTRLVFDFNQRTAGQHCVGNPCVITGWHQNQSLQFERAIFSQASHTPITTDLRIDASTCRRGMSALLADAATGCLGNSTIGVTIATPQFNISPAATGAPLEFAKLTGPNRLAGTNAEKVSSELREGFGLVNGGNTAAVTWAQPPANPDETVTAYALVIAIPGNQGSRYGQRLSTPGTCGLAGTSPICSKTLTAGAMPRLDGNGSLHPDSDAGGKYDVAVITIWASGKRSDGRCDDGTWQGALCAPTTPLWRLNAIKPVNTSGNVTAVVTGYPDAGRFGTSRWQFLWRTHAYPSVSMETAFNSNGTGTADDETEPFMLLFVDYTIKQAEFVIYGGYQIKSNITAATRFIAAGNAGDGPATSFLSRDNRIIGDGKVGSVQFSNNASPTGTARRFDYIGETDNSGTFGLVSLYEPGDIALGSSVPPNPTSSRPMYSAIEFMEGGTV